MTENPVMQNQELPPNARQTKEVKAAIKLAEENKSEVKAFKIRLRYVNASAESPVYDRLYDYAESAKLPALFHTGDTAFSNGDPAAPTAEARL